MDSRRTFQTPTPTLYCRSCITHTRSGGWLNRTLRLIVRESIVFFVNLDSSVACWRMRRGQTASQVISVRPLVFSRQVRCAQRTDQLGADPCSSAWNAIDLIDYGGSKVDADYAHMIQSFHRFLVDHLSSEGNAFPHNPILLKNQSSLLSPHSPAAAPITQLLGIDAKNVITCMSCKAVREKENMTHIVDMIYPRKVSFFSMSSLSFRLTPHSQPLMKLYLQRTSLAFFATLCSAR